VISLTYSVVSLRYPIPEISLRYAKTSLFIQGVGLIDAVRWAATLGPGPGPWHGPGARNRDSGSELLLTVSGPGPGPVGL
jgi:hypothetical protein